MTTARLMTVATLTAIADAAAYVSGTRADRRIVRQRIAKAYARDTQVRQEYMRRLTIELEDAAEAIEMGLRKRTIRPRTLRYVANGYLEAHPAA